jgi:hypothetical protein
MEHVLTLCEQPGPHGPLFSRFEDICSTTTAEMVSPDHWMYSATAKKQIRREEQKRRRNSQSSNVYSIQMMRDCQSRAHSTDGGLMASPQKTKPTETEEERAGTERENCSTNVCVSIDALPLASHVECFRPQVASSLFLAHNTALVPPYRVLIDTNFINFSLQNKLELVSGMMDCLYAKCASIRRLSVWLLASDHSQVFRA